MSTLPPDLLVELEWLEKSQSDEDVTPKEWQARGNRLLESAGSLDVAQLKEFQTAFEAFQQRESDRSATTWLRAELSANAPVFVSADDLTQLYQVGAVSVRVPALPPEPGPLRDVVERRREADLSGRCECGASALLRSGSYVIDHHDDCPASDEHLRTALQRAGRLPA